MREIKFRAFGVLGERKNKWFYGSSEVEKYINTDKRDCHLSLHGFERLIKGEFLDKKTRGEFIGMLDKNDIEIYEGDICLIENCFIDFKNKLYSHIGEVKYTACRFMVVDEYLNSLSPFEYKNSIEVISNIYENPELLE